LRYSPHVFAQFADLVKDTCSVLGKPNYYWNRSVMTLYEVLNYLVNMKLINTIPIVDKRSSNLALLNELITLASEPALIRTGNSLLFMIWYFLAANSLSYDILIELSGKMVDSSDAMRKRLKLPLQVNF
jgi:hypothetical protein